MVESRCVVQWYNNCSNQAAGIALHASLADRTRDVWARFVVLHVLLFSRFTSRDTRAFDLSQCRKITPGSLEKGKRSGDRESEKNLRMKKKERQKVSLCKVGEMCECSHADRLFLSLVIPAPIQIAVRNFYTHFILRF